MTQATLVETCRHNLQTSLLAQIGVAESRTWKQLVQQDEQAEEIVARVRAEENKPRPEKSTRRAPEISFQSKKKIHWRQRQNPLSNLSRPGEVVLQVSHALISSIPSKTNMLIRCSSYSTRATDWSFLKLDVLRKSARPTIRTTFVS